MKRQHVCSMFFLLSNKMEVRVHSPGNRYFQVSVWKLQSVFTIWRYLSLKSLKLTSMTVSADGITLSGCHVLQRCLQVAATGRPMKDGLVHVDEDPLQNKHLEVKIVKRVKHSQDTFIYKYSQLGGDLAYASRVLTVNMQIVASMWRRWLRIILSHVFQARLESYSLANWNKINLQTHPVCGISKDNLYQIFFFKFKSSEEEVQKLPFIFLDKPNEEVRRTVNSYFIMCTTNLGFSTETGWLDCTYMQVWKGSETRNKKVNNTVCYSLKVIPSKIKHEIRAIK